MSESVIFNSPLLLVLYGIALALCLFELKSRATGYVLPLLSAVIVVSTSAYALLLGASLFETIIVILIFLLIHIANIGEGKK